MDFKRMNPFRGATAERRQRQDHRNAADKDLIRQMQGGSLTVLDMFGRPLELQDDVQYQPQQALIFKIIGASPVLDPNVPPGVVQLTLVATVPVNVMSRQPTANLMLVGRHGAALQPVAAPSPMPPEPGKASENGNGEPEKPSGLVLTDK